MSKFIIKLDPIPLHDDHGRDVQRDSNDTEGENVVDFLSNFTWTSLLKMQEITINLFCYSHCFVDIIIIDLVRIDHGYRFAYHFSCDFHNKNDQNTWDKM